MLLRETAAHAHAVPVLQLSNRPYDLGLAHNVFSE